MYLLFPVGHFGLFCPASFCSLLQGAAKGEPCRASQDGQGTRVQHCVQGWKRELVSSGSLYSNSSTLFGASRGTSFSILHVI